MNNLKGKTATFRFVKKGTTTPGKVKGIATVKFVKKPSRRISPKKLA